MDVAIEWDEVTAVKVVEDIAPGFTAAAAAADVGGFAVGIDHLAFGHADARRTGAFLGVFRTFLAILLGAGGFGGGGF